ncbi:M56 family metallopeptidase [Fulvivirga ligni]|uniref:M56 family metallopeptidase n=1 Tax=Fulvivirga ligni TaxID=2904246 RepID=UPI001F391391|nr:M56 family metallopeptidase [Fulvivirga ligni]UII19221.1 TonB family protein [Fulvivirga ligni]
MNDIINFFIEANICLIVLGLFYICCLRKENHHKFIRFYLLGAAVVSLVLPLLHLGSFIPIEQNTSGAEVGISNILTLPEFTVFGKDESSEISLISIDLGNFTVFGVVTFIYLTISAILLTVFFYRVIQILNFKNTKKSTPKEDHQFIFTDGQLPTFAFFNLLFFDNSVKLTEEERQKIIDHELVHIKERHSWDIVIYEFLKVLFWLNPLVWFLKKRLQHTHEYLADQSILKSTDTQHYSYILAKMTLNQMSLGLAHHFNQSFTLKRIKMMNRPITKFKTWKWFALVPVVSLLIIALACNDEVIQDVSDVMATAHQSEIPEELKPELASLQKKHPNAHFVYMETDASNDEALARLKNIDPQSIGFMKVYKEREMIGMIVNQDGPLDKIVEVADVQSGDEESFVIVEDPAMPAGGYQAFYEELAKVMKYPQQARKMGVEGKVYLQFVVDETGALTNVVAVKGIGAGCDEEAKSALLKAAEGAPWKPGKQRGKAVKQRIVLPVTFKLGNDDNTAQVEMNDIIELPSDAFQLDIKHNGLEVTGIVKNQDGKPLPGTNIIIENSTSGTVSDRDGSFKIKLNNKSDKLVFSYIGFETKTYTIQ